MDNKIEVKNSGIVKLDQFGNSLDGRLIIAESGKKGLFDIKRVYYITDLGLVKSSRGNHAHKNLKQYIFCVSGSFTLHLDDGEKKQDIVMNDPSLGVCLGPKLWHVMSDFSKDCVMLVLANDYYNEEDYIRNYDDFIKYIHDKV